ncbi:MAG: metal-dependent transcriptional regulator [Clostridia bacterium]|nr:metal-dependent transcriptional regulator [Clostridia bacterium]
MNKNSTLTPVLGSYLEAIYLKGIKGYSVRTTDVANELGISKSGVNRAVNVLKSMGLVSHQSYGGIVITNEGRDTAKRLLKKNELVKQFLICSLKLDESEAAEEAKRLEHIIGQKTLNEMETYVSINAG